MNNERVFQLLNRITTDEGRAYDYTQPFRREVNGVKYAITTDGRSMLAIEVSQEDFDQLREAPMKEPERIDPWLARTKTSSLDMAGLLSFLNAAEYHQCPLCKGSGERLLQMPNVEADEDKPWYLDPFTYYSQDDCLVRICGVPMDRNRVVNALAWMPLQESLDVSEPDDMEKAPIVFFGEDDGGCKWALVVMPMKAGRTLFDSVPEFPPVEARKAATLDS